MIIEKGLKSLLKKHRASKILSNLDFHQFHIWRTSKTLFKTKSFSLWDWDKELLDQWDSSLQTTKITIISLKIKMINLSHFQSTWRKLRRLINLWGMFKKSQWLFKNFQKKFHWVNLLKSQSRMNRIRLFQMKLILKLRTYKKSSKKFNSRSSASLMLWRNMIMTFSQEWQVQIEKWPTFSSSLSSRKLETLKMK